MCLWGQFSWAGFSYQPEPGHQLHTHKRNSTWYNFDRGIALFYFKRLHREFKTFYLHSEIADNVSRRSKNLKCANNNARKMSCVAPNMTISYLYIFLCQGVIKVLKYFCHGINGNCETKVFLVQGVH